MTGKKGLNMISFPFQPSQGVQETISRAGTSFCGIPSKTDQEHLGKGFWLDRSESLSDDYEAVMQSIFLRFWSPGELVWSITSSLWSDFPPFHPSWLLFWSFRLGEHQQSIITRKNSCVKLKPTCFSPALKLEKAATELWSVSKEIQLSVLLITSPGSLGTWSHKVIIMVITQGYNDDDHARWWW